MKRRYGNSVYSSALRSLLAFPLTSLLVFLFISTSYVRAQDDSDTDVVRVRTDLVTTPAFVTDSGNRRVMNLTAADFELRDNGDIVKIEYFVSGAESVDLLFVLDASGSTRDVISRQREVALALLSRFGSGSEIAVVRFADTSKLVAPFSNVASEASRAFDLPAAHNRRTAIFDALANSIQYFAARRTTVSARRIIILISDGLDTVSTVKPRDLIDEAANLGVSIYSIQIPLFAPIDGRLRPRAASKGFRDVAEKSGGQFFMAGDARSPLSDQSSYDLSPIFQSIENDLRGQYLLGYYPEVKARDGSVHKIDLKLAARDKRKLRVHLLRKEYSSRQ